LCLHEDDPVKEICSEKIEQFECQTIENTELAVQTQTDENLAETQSSSSSFLKSKVSNAQNKTAWRSEVPIQAKTV
jgi:hypothetical protein